MTINILRIVEGTSVDGPGLRTSIYMAGCPHHCEGCHNPQSWGFEAGTPTTIDNLMHVIANNEAPVTLTGGDPLAHPVEVLKLVRRIKAELGYNIWCYTGYTWEQITHHPQLTEVVRHVDVVVDSPFVLALRDTSLRFRGSSNQRVIDVNASLSAGHAIECEQYADVSTTHFHQLRAQ
ncbi:MAG: anaerobic ribonucleoside-triphosphate reductase activating protein [Muribaculaceae bacterium]|nr:anaerobic ribonucleoside-triphosphate reductase activating protein [Muribaculaceae bacterium]